MSAISKLYHFDQLVNDDQVYKAMRSNYLPFSAAILSQYFTGSQNRMLTVEFHRNLNADIAEIERTQEFLKLNIGQKTATQWCTYWIHDVQLLARIQDESTKEEYYQLTSTGQQLLAFLDSRTTQTHALTQSRLLMLVNGFSELEKKTNPDKKYRLKSLREQKRKIEEEIERVKGGDIRVLSKELATADLMEYTALAKQVPQDFARVRELFREIGAKLRSELIDSNLPQEEVLKRVFSGLDEIEETEAGKSFNAFYDLLMDSNMRTAFTEAIQGLNQRGYLEELDLKDKTMLLTFISTLSNESFPVQEMMRTISRNLREFVTSRQFEQFRALSELLNEIQRLGTQNIAAMRLHEHIVSLEGTSAELRSVGRLEFAEPVRATIDEEIYINEPEELDIEALLKESRKSEIDFTTLTNHVNSALTQFGPQSVANVLEHFPAEQGVASVLGLLILAQRHGTAFEGEKELVSWTGMFDSLERAAFIPRYVFEKEI